MSIAAIILDLAVVAIIAFSIYRASVKGFMRTLVSFLGCFAALILSVVLSWVVSDLVYGSIVRPRVISRVETAVDSTGLGNTAQIIETATESMPKFIVKMANTNGLFEQLETKEAAAKLSGGTESAAAVIADTVAKPVVTGLVQVISMAVLFVAGLIAVKLLSRILNKLVSGKYLGGLNGFLGGVIGIPRGIIFALIFVWVVGFLVYTNESGILGVTPESAENTYLFGIMNSFNPLLK